MAEINAGRGERILRLDRAIIHRAVGMELGSMRDLSCHGGFHKRDLPSQHKLIVLSYYHNIIIAVPGLQGLG